MTLAATTGGVVALAAHQALAAVFFVGCKFGDAVSQTAQAYLPPCFDPSEDGPPPAPLPQPREQMYLRKLSCATRN